MPSLFNELISHQAWADAEHWRTLRTNPVLLNDETLRKRLYHYHITQRAFLLIARGEELVFPKPEDFASILAIKDYAKQTNDETLLFLKSVPPSRLSKRITIPWFKDPPLQITVKQALTQAAMHSQHHRAQNASRMRELGVEPPTTDFIFWLWKGKSEAAWT